VWALKKFLEQEEFCLANTSKLRQVYLVGGTIMISCDNRLEEDHSESLLRHNVHPLTVLQWINEGLLGIDRSNLYSDYLPQTEKADPYRAHIEKESKQLAQIEGNKRTILANIESLNRPFVSRFKADIVPRPLWSLLPHPWECDE